MLHYENTVGHDYHRAGDMYFKVGQHHVRMSQYPQARYVVGKYIAQHLLTVVNSELFDKALAVYNLSYHKAERARVLHWRAKIATGTDTAVLEAEAARLLQETRAERDVEGRSFDDRDYDQLVVFWSR